MGTPLSWEETKYYANHVRHHGIEQFINVFHKNKGQHLYVIVTYNISL